MDLEETKKIIQNKIEADESAREVRSQIKTYIHEKQTLREGFTETFKPLIETSEAVKTSIDTQQNKLIKQLQDNQLALTQGFEGNRKAITSGFDKMDEVKKWDLSQLPGYEAIEEPEMEEMEEPEFYWITKNDFELLQGENESKLREDGEELIEISKELFYDKLSEDKLNQDKYKFKKNTSNPGYTIIEIVEREQGGKPENGVVTFDDTDLDEGLLNKRSVEVLKNLKLPSPSKLKNEKLEDILLYQKNAEVHLNYFGDLLSPNKAIIYKEKRVSKAVKKNKDPNRDTTKQIKVYNILGQYIHNIDGLVKYAKKKEGKGIIHFNNPQQLVDRLELLAGSIFAGNNGVKQEFSQIAHLLHQLKVITKRTLNDLLKKYVLNK